MKYTTVYVQQLKDRKGKPWQARAKYKDVYGKWKEVSKMLPEAKGIREAKRMANEWLDELNAQADLMPNAGKQQTLDKVYKEYLKHQLDTSEIEKSAVLHRKDYRLPHYIGVVYIFYRITLDFRSMLKVRASE